MKELNGKLEAYWEQGWDGRVEFALQIDGASGPFFMESGQQLTIYQDDGEIIWSGRIHFVKVNHWFDKHTLSAKIWSWSKQKGVSYAEWMDWFWRKPPLHAKLVIEE